MPGDGDRGKRDPGMREELRRRLCFRDGGEDGESSTSGSCQLSEDRSTGNSAYLRRRAPRPLTDQGQFRIRCPEVRLRNLPPPLPLPPPLLLLLRHTAALRIEAIVDVDEDRIHVLQQ